MNQQLSHFCWQMANRNKTMNGQEKNFSSLQKRLIYIWFCDASELSFLWLISQFVFLAFLRLGFDFILQLYVCICLVSFSAQVIFFGERQSLCVSLFDFFPIKIDKQSKQSHSAIVCSQFLMRISGIVVLPKSIPIPFKDYLYSLFVLRAKRGRRIGRTMTLKFILYLISGISFFSHNLP